MFSILIFIIIKVVNIICIENFYSNNLDCIQGILLDFYLKKNNQFEKYEYCFFLIYFMKGNQ